MLKKIYELEGATSSVGIVPMSKLEDLKRYVVLFQEDNFFWRVGSYIFIV